MKEHEIDCRCYECLKKLGVVRKAEAMPRDTSGEGTDWKEELKPKITIFTADYEPVKHHMLLILNEYWEQVKPEIEKLLSSQKELLLGRATDFFKQEYGYKGKLLTPPREKHGPCCTCSKCGQYHDDCVCENNRIHEFLESLSALSSLSEGEAIVNQSE